MEKAFFLSKVDLRKRLRQVIATAILTIIIFCIPGNIYGLYIFGYDNGMIWFISDNGGAGSSSFDPTIYNGFNISWNSQQGSTYDFTCGKVWGSGDEYMKVHYEGGLEPGANAFIAFNGWMQLSASDPYQLAEYYVVESYGDSLPVDLGSNPVSLGTVTSDGSTYTIYRTTQINRSCIATHKRESYYQYWSVRTPKLQPGSNLSGNITLINHINAWRNIDFPIGDLSKFYQGMVARGYGGTGSANLKTYGIINRPYVQRIKISVSSNYNADVLYINSEKKMTPTEYDYPTGNKAVFDMHVLDYEFVDWNNWKRFIPIVALKSLRTNQYVTVVNTSNHVKADSNSISTAQKFYYQNNYGYCDFRSLYNNKSLESSGRCGGENYANLAITYLY